LPRFILRYHGEGPAPRDDVARFKGALGITVLDDSPRMLLVDGGEDELRKFLGQTSEWVMSPEASYALPEPHPSLEKARSFKRSK